MARQLTKDDIISNVYYNVDTGFDFGAVADTLKEAKEKDPSINRVDVENWLEKQPDKQIRRYRGSNSFTAPLARFEYQIDIMDMLPLTKGLDASKSDICDGIRIDITFESRLFVGGGCFVSHLNTCECLVRLMLFFSFSSYFV